MTRSAWSRRLWRRNPVLEDRHEIDPTHPSAEEPPARELATRVADGIGVVLRWRPAHDDVTVSVDDAHSGHSLEFTVAGELALDAFHHPFAYALRSSGTRLHRDHGAAC